MGNRKHFFKPSFPEQNGSRYYAWRDTGRDSIIVVPSRAFAQYQTLSLARRPACVVKGTPSYIVGQAWSLPSYRRVGVPAHARLRGRCSRRATTGSASALSSSGPSMNPACLLRRVHSFKNRIIPRFLPFEPCVSNRLFYAPIYR